MKLKIRFFCIVALIWGMLYAFLIPLWQVPDEIKHIKMIEQEIKSSNLAETMLEEAPLEEHRVRWNLEERIDVRLLKDAMMKKAEYQKADCLPRGISIRIVRHFPATIGISLGVMFGMPAYWVLMMGRFFSLAFYIAVCAVSLWLMPLNKELFEAIMLLPICIQEAASLSYDAVLMPLCFLLVAYLLYLKFSTLNIGLHNLLVIIGIIFCIGVIKPPYIALAGAFLTIPMQKIHIKVGKYVITGESMMKLKWVICAVVAVAVIVCVYLGRDNQWVRLVMATLTNLPRTIWLIGRTGKVWGEHIFESMIGKFGYFDARTATWFISIVTAFVLITAMADIKGKKESEESLSIKDRIIMYITLGGCFYLVTISMISFSVGYDVGFSVGNDAGFSAGYNSYDWNESLYEIIAIDGLQGRYYIPMLLLFLLPLPKILKVKERDYNVMAVGMSIFACIYTCSVIWERYWLV